MTADPNGSEVTHAAGADIQAQGIARVYAEAFLNAAEKGGQADAVIEELSSLIKDVYRSQPEFESFLSSGAIGRDRKAEVIDRIFQGRANDLFVNFLQVLNMHERLSLLRPILAALVDLNSERRQRVKVQVRSAIPLSDAERERLSKEIRLSFKREPILETGVDADLLGGLVVRVGDLLYDASIKTKLDSIRNQLIERSSYEIQSRRDRFRTTNGD
jgi:F-type H+-transporting ATPase subunit delta